MRNLLVLSSLPGPQWCQIGGTSLSNDRFGRPQVHSFWSKITIPDVTQKAVRSRNWVSISFLLSLPLDITWLLLIVFPRLPMVGSPPSQLPRYRYLSCSHPCPGGAHHPRSYRVPASAQVGLGALEVTRVSLFCDRSPRAAPLTEVASQSLEVLVGSPVPDRLSWITCQGPHVHELTNRLRCLQWSHPSPHGLFPPPKLPGVLYNN